MAVALIGTAHAQLAASLQFSKQQYLAGEPVLAKVTITNHSGRELTFLGSSRMPWLEFILKDRRGETVTPRANTSFGKLTIKAGESLAREVDLSQHFILTEPGNFSAIAMIHMPGSTTDGFSTNRVPFDQNPGSLYWTQKVGIASKPGMTREFRVLNFNGDKAAQIYAQIVDGRTGQNVRTFPLGDVLMIRKPLVTVDRQQRLHVMYLATPTMWVHYQIDTDGKVVNRQIHQRAASGDPQLLVDGNGNVVVGNSIPYDPKAAAEAKAKVRKASDRPPGTY